MTKITFLTTCCLLLFFHWGNAQVISSKVLDSATQKPIPYATVLLSNKKGVITNEEGRFSIRLNDQMQPTDSLFISCIGYESIGKPLNQFTEPVIFMRSKAIELKSVILTNKNFTPEEIIAKVKANLDKNYNRDFTKKKLFFRESYHNYLAKTDYTFKKSTIKELNKAFLDSVIQSVPKRDDRYTEVLCDLYGNYDRKNQKIKLIKASELYDKSSELDLTSLEERFNKIIKDNVKPNSYFKIKSGIFGTKVGADEIFDEAEDEEKNEDAEALKKELEAKKKREELRKKNFALYRRNTMAGLFDQFFFMEDSKLNFLRKSKRYEFTQVDFTYLGDDAVYILDFKPKRSADYKGRLYINSDDFAIIRVDYDNVKPLRNFRLLGISMKEYLDSGKMIFSKGANDKYDLRFLESESANRVGIRRPLKIIEKNKFVKGRRKQNELSVKIDMAVTSRNKYEIVIFDTEHVSNSIFEGVAENNAVLPTYMPRYDASFWEGYNIIEPNQAIKEFTATTEE
ncbi:carboxypeptidase-like regulatory domain-containing protein [Spongiimicrobium salis]|uniref:carboxypeptidase-like regulatory domain-containing protein n=1 Tax=Spongiimicrobium salis TaxID=1667022 RepID=UPI00374DE1A5